MKQSPSLKMGNAESKIGPFPILENPFVYSRGYSLEFSFHETVSENLSACDPGEVLN